MRYLALASDYDGTLAAGGRVDEQTLAALGRLRASGRKLLLVTGRELEDLERVFPDLHVFDTIVAENGALLYRPSTREHRLLAERPPDEFVRELGRRGVSPLSRGHVIVATWHPLEDVVLRTIRDLGLELQVIFNKGAVMVLPSGVNKASGLDQALVELGLSAHNVVGVGDAENDHAFLAECGVGVAVANALPSVRERADWTTARDHGAGVMELVERMIHGDLAELRPSKRRMPLGTRADGGDFELDALAGNVLLTGASGSGKSTLATAFLERLAAARYQFCIIDPEGDYEAFEAATPLGDGQSPPPLNEVIDLLDRRRANVTVNLIGVKLADRPACFASLISRVLELRARTGRPHWIVLDEAHHLLPAAVDPATAVLPKPIDGLLMVTVHPDQVAPMILGCVDTVLVVGAEPAEPLARFARVVGLDPPPSVGLRGEPGWAVGWHPGTAEPPAAFRVLPPEAERRRHHRKYAEGRLPSDRSFYFRGPHGALNLRAHNLVLFTDLADGVDDDTWEHHRRQGDYSRWLRDKIKDPELGDEAAAIESDAQLDAAESRRRIREAIEKRYTLPAAD